MMYIFGSACARRHAYVDVVVIWCTSCIVEGSFGGSREREREREREGGPYSEV